MANDIAEIRGMDTRELRARLHDLRKEKFNLGFRGSAEEVAKTARHRQIRRTVARIMTVLAQRELAPADAPAREVATAVAAVSDQKGGAETGPKRAGPKSHGDHAVAATPPVPKGDIEGAPEGGADGGQKRGAKGSRKTSSPNKTGKKSGAATGSKAGKAGGKQ